MLKFHLQSHISSASLITTVKGKNDILYTFFNNENVCSLFFVRSSCYNWLTAFLMYLRISYSTVQYVIATDTWNHALYIRIWFTVDWLQGRSVLFFFIMYVFVIMCYCVQRLCYSNSLPIKQCSVLIFFYL